MLIVLLCTSHCHIHVSSSAHNTKIPTKVVWLAVFDKKAQLVIEPNCAQLLYANGGSCVPFCSWTVWCNLAPSLVHYSNYIICLSSQMQEDLPGRMGKALRGLSSLSTVDTKVYSTWDAAVELTGVGSSIYVYASILCPVWRHTVELTQCPHLLLFWCGITQDAGGSPGDGPWLHSRGSGHSLCQGHQATARRQLPVHQRPQGQSCECEPYQ